MLTLFKCRSSTPLREKARPKRLLAIQCWADGWKEGKSTFQHPLNGNALRAL